MNLPWSYPSIKQPETRSPPLSLVNSSILNWIASISVSEAMRTMPISRVEPGRSINAAICHDCDGLIFSALGQLKCIARTVITVSYAIKRGEFIKTAWIPIVVRAERVCLLKVIDLMPSRRRSDCCRRVGFQRSRTFDQD
jgi:hypothetical protein